MGKIGLVILLLIISSIAFSQNNIDIVAKGNEWYKKGDFKQAIDQYKKATEIDPLDSVAPYNLGNALRRLNQLEAAEKAYLQAAKVAKEKNGKSKSTYNDGVAFTRQNKLPESIDAYKQALRLNPTDQQARENLQMALNQLKKQSSSGGGGNENKKQEKKDNKDQKNENKINEKQAEQMLSALREDEKKLQQNVQKRNTNNPGSNKQDW